MFSFRKKIDNRLIHTFLKLNKFKVKSFNKNKKILLIDRNLPESNIVSCYFSYILNKNFEYDIYLLNNQSEKNILNKIYYSFDIKKYLI